MLLIFSLFIVHFVWTHSYRSEQLLPMVLRQLIHYIWHRSENKHRTSQPALLPSLTPRDVVDLVCVFWPGLPGLGETVCCSVASPGRRNSRTARHRTWARSRSHFFPSVVFHSIKPANQQRDLTLETSKRERGGEGREGNAVQCVRRGKWAHDRTRAWSWSLFPDCLQIASSLMSAVKLNLHTHTHTQITTEAIQSERGFSPESIVQISWPYNSQQDQMKPDLCSERWLSLQ